MAPVEEAETHGRKSLRKVKLGQGPHPELFTGEGKYVLASIITDFAAGARRNRGSSISSVDARSMLVPRRRWFENDEAHDAVVAFPGRNKFSPIAAGNGLASLRQTISGAVPFNRV